ncbi:questin oxidase family protein [Streptomyces pathocidini]|uniref:Questin oxidase family protein n=1 Tax=Streptomyces pathocidini TaxID=1650571 RepID=A0ABW7UWY7_9ACTN|nr:questin oxidase family protein [Streptomyces pathocidini]
MTVLDEALTYLQDCGPEWGPGVSNHGPMAAEALVRLGRPEAVGRFVGNYRKMLYRDAPVRSLTIDETNWQAALGNMRLLGDWNFFFRTRLAERPWKEVLAHWWPRLLPGLPAGGGHGVIRTGHAVRALAEKETPERVNELALGLGYWAARYQEVPGSGRFLGRHDLPDTWNRVPRLHTRQGIGEIFRIRLEALYLQPDFGEIVDDVRRPDDVDGALSVITRLAAQAYLTDDHEKYMGFVHALTVPAAVRLVLGHLPAEQHWPTAATTWQFTAAIRSAYGTGHREPAAPVTPVGYETLIDRAVATGDPHAIKYVEACRREDEQSADPIYAVVATDWIRRMEDGTWVE